MRSLIKNFLCALAFVSIITAPAFAHTPTPSGPLVTYEVPPAGFEYYTVQPGDTWNSIVGEEDALFAMKVNRIDEKHLRAGTKIIVPFSSSAYDFVPVPEQIRAPGRQYIAFLEEQYFGLYEDGQLMYWGPIASARQGKVTPLGSWSALYKEADKVSYRYNNAPMPFSIQYDGNYFIHGQALPGRPASAGCIRMFIPDAEFVFGLIQRGDAISVVANTSHI